MVTEVVAAVILTIVGLVHLVPGVIAVAPSRTATAYGTSIPDRDFELLLRHRAVLLGTVGIGLIVGAFVTAARPATITAGIISTASFLALTAVVGPSRLNSRTLRVARVDVIALIALIAATCLLAVGD